MNPKTLQYLMGHSDIGVTMNVYTHLGMEDAAAEMARMEEVESARREQEKLSGVKEGKEKQSRKMLEWSERSKELGLIAVMAVGSFFVGGK